MKDKHELQILDRKNGDTEFFENLQLGRRL